MKHFFVLGALLVGSFAVGVRFLDSGHQVASAVLESSWGEGASRGLPIFELNPSWPAVPDQWVLGEVSSVGVDQEGRIIVLQRPRSLLIHAPDSVQFAAPPILEFDADGNFLKGWGGEGDGFEWPQREHGIEVDHQGNIWIGGNNCPANQAPGLHPVSDDQILKFSRDGEFLLQIGRSNQARGNSDTQNLYEPADVTVHAPTNEVFVADGYGNRRIAVFDADTGEFKRMWGAFGNEPEEAGCPWPDPLMSASEVVGEGPAGYDIVHGVAVSADGFVYVADRSYGRVQVFTLDGTYINQVVLGQPAGHVAFSPDDAQEFLYIAASGEIVIIDRMSLEVLSSFPAATAHHFATDSEGNIYTARVGQARVAHKYEFKGFSQD